MPLSRSGAASAALAIGLLAMLSLLFCHMVLAPLGHWADEFGTFTLYRTQSTAALYGRLSTWSPRPLSETLIFLYAKLCDQTQAPLFTQALSVCWLIFLAPSLVLTCLAVMRPASGIDRLCRATLAVALPTISLLSVELADTFLWPMSAFAYLPGLACITGLLFLAMFGPLNRRGTWLALCVVGSTATLCVEMSAMVAGFFFLTLLLWTLTRHADGDVPPRFRVACCLPPMLVALGVGFAVLTHRASQGSPLTQNVLLVHHPAASIATAMPIFAEAMLGHAASIYLSTPPLVGAHAAALALYFIGATFLTTAFELARRPGSATMLCLLALASLTACFVSVAATLYQFGIMCCERHDTARTCLEFIALTALAACLADRLAASLPMHALGVFRPVLGLLLILTACALLAPDRLHRLAILHRQSPMLRMATNLTWQSGWDRTSDVMSFIVQPRDPLAGFPSRDHGVHLLAQEPSWQTRGIMTYFEKDAVRFEQRR